MQNASDQSRPTPPNNPAAQNWRPAYWSKKHGSAWSRVREAFSRDWEQTKKDFTGTGTELNQSVPDTVRQATGNAPIPPRGKPNPSVTLWQEAEPAVRYGFGARQQYGAEHPDWNESLEQKLATEWDAEKTGRPFADVHQLVRAGWDKQK